MSKKNPAQKGPKLQIDNEVTRCIRQHARAHMKTEVCGVLIGEEKGDTIEVQASIEASNAAQAGTHVTFTQDAWEEIFRVKDQSYPDHRIVGWYHSHPGFGVFLSEHDNFIHRNFFSSPDQVAWVYDPHTDEEGCFGWWNGEIQRVAALSIVDLNGDGEERTPKERSYAEVEAQDAPAIGPPARESRAINSPPALLRVVITAASYLMVAAAGFLIAYLLFPVYVGIGIDPSTGNPIMIDGQPMVMGRLHIARGREAQPSAPQAGGTHAATPQSAAPPQPNSAPGSKK
jgi:proteasome lid subunit RPN8/RPN11